MARQRAARRVTGALLVRHERRPGRSSAPPGRLQQPARVEPSETRRERLDLSLDPAVGTERAAVRRVQ